jgi:hypothetical protein
LLHACARDRSVRDAVLAMIGSGSSAAAIEVYLDSVVRTESR